MIISDDQNKTGTTGKRTEKKPKIKIYKLLALLIKLPYKKM